MLNDAVAITVFKVANTYIGTSHFSAIDGLLFVLSFLAIFFGSFAIGVATGIVAAMMQKHIGPKHRILEMLITLGSVYVPFLLSG